jgi:hypothetical protein
MDLYIILDWKAARARTRHLARLARIAGNFEAAVAKIATDLREWNGPERQLGSLLTTWGFRLPTASAILTVLYPDTFTIYDIRLCDRLGAFRNLVNMKWSPRLWEEYQRFVAAVRSEAPEGLTLRDCDRWLWGEDKKRVLLHDLAVSR